MIDQRQLIKDCLRGKPQAQKQLYDAFAETMLGVCYRYTKSMADAEDVLQESFVKVFTHLHQYKEEGQLGGWIRKIVVNTALNYLKRSRNYQTELVFHDDGLHPVSDDNPAMNMAVKEIAALIRQLPTGYQTIFNLHAIEGFSHVEIGQMLGIKDTTSRSQYLRARSLLITWMENFESVHPKTNNYAQ